MDVRVVGVDPLLVPQILDVHGDDLSARIVAQGVEPSELRGGLVDEILAGTAVGEVFGDQEGTLARIFDPSPDFLRAVLLNGEVGQRNISAFAGEGDRDGCPDSGICAGDQCLPAPESAGAAIGVLTDRLRDEVLIEPRLRLMLLGRGDLREPVRRVLEVGWSVCSVDSRLPIGMRMG